MVMRLIGYCAAVATAGLLAAASASAEPQVTMRQSPPAAAPTMPDPVAPPFAVPDRFSRARDNLVALRDGRLSVADLTDLELQDVLDLDRALRERSFETRTPQQQCVDDEVRRAGGKPSRLEWQVIDLKCRP
jgi:hypothetical protein